MRNAQLPLNRAAVLPLGRRVADRVRHVSPAKYLNVSSPQEASAALPPRRSVLWRRLWRDGAEGDRRGRWGWERLAHFSRCSFVNVLFYFFFQHCERVIFFCCCCCCLQESQWSANPSWRTLGAPIEKPAQRELRAWLIVTVWKEEPRRRKIAKRENGNRTGLVSFFCNIPEITFYFNVHVSKVNT